MDQQDSGPARGQVATYSVCRKLPTFSCLSNQDLAAAIEDSVETYHAALQQFDKSLPKCLHKGIEATWLEFTCVTVHVCNLLNGFCLGPAPAAGMMRHIDLLYRVDDFMETMVETYGVHDISAAKGLVQSCFDPYLNTSNIEQHANLKAIRIDSPLEDVPPITRLVELEQDLKQILEVMHASPISEASPQDRRWYSLELYDFFTAQLEQIAYKPSKPTAPTELYTWVTDIGARSVGTKYMFAGFSCMISASRDQEIRWPSAREMYMAQQFAQHVSVEFRLLNDIGGRVRDEREGTASSCSLVRAGEFGELEEIAAYEAECSQNLIRRMSEASAARDRADEASQTRRLLEFWRKTVRLSGELYMADDPTREPTLSNRDVCRT